MKVTLKQLPETVLKNSCPLNSMSLKKASVAKLYNGICRCFAKEQEIGLVYLSAERRILQYCFCQ